MKSSKFVTFSVLIILIILTIYVIIQNKNLNLKIFVTGTGGEPDVLVYMSESLCPDDRCYLEGNTTVEIKLMVAVEAPDVR